jgi:hypothetical protein
MRKTKRRRGKEEKCQRGWGAEEQKTRSIEQINVGEQRRKGGDKETAQRGEDKR